MMTTFSTLIYRIKYRIKKFCDFIKEVDRRRDNMESNFKKKTGWVNIYKDYDDTIILGDVHDTREEAISITNKSLTYLDTIKIIWNERYETV